MNPLRHDVAEKTKKLLKKGLLVILAWLAEQLLEKFLDFLITRF